MSSGPKERHLETLIHSTLRDIVLTHMHPRTLIQLTLQIVNTPEQENTLPASFVRSHASFSTSHSTLTQRPQALSPLPALLNAAMLAFLSASIPMTSTFTSTLLAIQPSGSMSINPSPKLLLPASSAHVFAFSSTGNLILDLSEGEFDLDTWEKAHDKAKEECCKEQLEENAMEEGKPSLQGFVERVVEARVDKERAWKNG
jgi:exosome complex component RRP46